MSPLASRHRAQSRKYAAETWFFPAAALYGALAVPFSLHAMLGGYAWLPGLADVTGHAHEMLFGYALAVVAGYLVSKATAARIAWLFVLWLAARMLWLGLPHTLLAVAANLAFALALAVTVAPKFMKGAKKLRNKAFGPLLLALCAAPVAFHAGTLAGLPGVSYMMLREGVLLLTLLMLFMGGRIIAPAVAGAIEKAGGRLTARVQPRIEGGLLVIMTLALAAALVPGAAPVTGIALMAAGVLALVRLLRWRPWLCLHRPDLLCLFAGYLWLAVGLGLMGVAWSWQWLAQAVATHAITIGALGTLTASVMARVRLLRARHDPAIQPLLPVIAAAMTTAALLRLFAGDVTSALWAAAALWSLGLTLVLVLLVRVR